MMSGVIASSLADSGDNATQDELKRLTAAVGGLTSQVKDLRGKV